ncbi:hypothetical protein [Salimicrobium album]|uniref:Uncharacterized protein n=1 Tax=Salimicrobium album TaxID=50717 RepID=A0A1H3EJF5_9BACI|nr:hypothetical protein [Salimicrobium album]SDX78902.1 hypothetical protein SAMN04488081_1251 [Salimicrobium album]
MEKVEKVVYVHQLRKEKFSIAAIVFGKRKMHKTENVYVATRIPSFISYIG